MKRGHYTKEIAKLRKRCTVCEKRFLAARPNRKYCSALCRHRAGNPLQGPLPKKKCEWCEKTFRPLQKRRQFCSDKCSHRAYTERNRAKYNSRMRELNYQTRVKAPWKLLILSARVRAKHEGLPCDLTNEWGVSVWTGRCAVSGLPFSLSHKAPRTLFSPTIDRIEPSGGYTQANSRFVLWGVNAFKQNGTDTDMLFIAEHMVMQRCPLVIGGILSLPG